MKDARTFMRQDFTLAWRAVAPAVDPTSCYWIGIPLGSEVAACKPADPSGVFRIEIEFTYQGIRAPQLVNWNLCFG